MRGVELFLQPIQAARPGATTTPRIRVESGETSAVLVADAAGWLPAQRMGATDGEPWFHVNLKTREISITAGADRASGAPALPLPQGYARVQAWAGQLQGNGTPFRIYIEG